MTYICSKFKAKLNKDRINKFSIVILLVFFYLGLISYITVPIKPLYHFLTSGSLVAVLIRAFMTGIICFYSVLVFLVNDIKVQWKWLIVFLIVLFLVLISIIISPLTYTYVYSEKLYGVVHLVKLNPGLPRTITMYLSSISDFAFAFCSLFILPIVVNNKKQLLALTLPIVLICLLECTYSFITERNTYKYLLTHPDDSFAGYGHQVGATFGDKESWGSFLTVAFASSLFSFISISNTKRIYRIIKIVLFCSILIFICFAIMSLCKTAMMAMLLALIILAIGLLVNAWRKNKKTGVIVLSCLGVMIALIIVCFSTNGFGISFIGKITTYLNNFIISRTKNALEGRMIIWINYLQNVRGYNLFFGLGKAGVNTYTKTIIKEGQSSLHNGFAYFFASYGIVGFSLFFVLLITIIKNIFKIYKFEPWLFFILIALFISAIVFVLSEAEVLIISTSNPIFIFNVLLVMFPKGYLIKKRGYKYG